MACSCQSPEKIAARQERMAAQAKRREERRAEQKAKLAKLSLAKK